ncbi:MAG: restriction endonuclease [Clostridia bacterium]|nr:restriction endonuclease [Clostridia bacterium]
MTEKKENANQEREAKKERRKSAHPINNRNGKRKQEGAERPATESVAPPAHPIDSVSREGEDNGKKGKGLREKKQSNVTRSDRPDKPKAENPVEKPKSESKKDNKIQKSELRTIVLKAVEQKDGQLKKKDLFDVCLKRFDLTAAEKRDRSPEGKWTNCRSVIGLAIAELVAEGKIVIDPEGLCRMPPEEKAESKEDADIKDALAELVVQILSSGEKLKKNELLNRCVAHYPKAKPQSVRCEGGKTIGALKSSGTISQNKQDGTFYIEERFPNTPLGKTLRVAYDGGDVKKCLIDALNLSGGPFFERFSVELMEKVLSRRGAVEKAEVTGGPDDGGIDGKIVYRDELGFRETVLLQAKLRNVTKSESAYESGRQITLKEVREFFGAAVAAKGTRFVWITTTTFCREAKYFIEKQPDFVGIDKKRLYELCKGYGVGVVLNAEGKEELDYKKFMN